MKIDNRTLVDLYREYIELNTASLKYDCPSSESLANSFIPSTSPREKKRIADHISHCRSCRDAFMILLQLQQCDASSAFDQDNRGRKNHPNKIYSKLIYISPFFRFSCVFVGLLLITTSALLIIQNNEFSRTSRSGGAGINLVYPVTTHPKSEKLIFQWKREPESRYYVLELFDEALLPLWTGQIADVLQMQLPDDVYSCLQIGKSYFWMVSGFSEDLKIDESPLTRFILINRP
jgi:hypothetical protein